MSITAAMVKELREKTGAGMMDCKTALNENKGDMEAAIDWLRAKGIAKAEKKSGRVAADGLVGIAQSDKAAVVVEINSETDFVAKNEQFQDLVRKISATALETDGSVEAISAATLSGGQKSVADTLTDAIATIGENINMRRAARLEVEKGCVATYLHNATGEGLGKIGVLVALESDGAAAALAGIGKQIGMHVAAMNPLAATKEEMPAELVEREKAVFVEQARESGKPDNIIEKMVEGRIRKFYEESVLMSQTFVVDGENSVEQALKNAEKEAGAPITLKGFVRMALGEGVEKEESDFAAEVAAMNKSDDSADAGAEAGEVIPFVDNIVLIDGIGDKTAEALATEGYDTLTSIAKLSDDELAALCEKVGAGQQWQTKEWKVQAEEMISGKPPRSKVDQELAKKLAKG